MRRPVLAAMTGLTAVVVGLGIKAGATPDGGSNAAAPTGVLSSAVDPTPSAEAATPSASALATSPTSGSTSVTVSPSPSAATTSTQVNGDAGSTRYGPVQVQITVKGGEITAVDAIVYPTQDRRDQEINSWAIPALDDEALRAQSAQIDTVSGATVTSEGYIASLQSAIDQANAAGLLQE